MGIIDNVKETVTLIQKIDNIDLYRKVLDLQSEVMAVVEENTELKRRLRISGDLPPPIRSLVGSRGESHTQRLSHHFALQRSARCPPGRRCVVQAVLPKLVRHSA